MWQIRGRKQRVLSPSHSIVFLISARIVLYRHRKSGHHLGTKVAKSNVLISTLMSEKSLYLQWFSQFKTFRQEKFKYYFIYSLSCERLRGRLSLLFSKNSRSHQAKPNTDTTVKNPTYAAPLMPLFIPAVWQPLSVFPALFSQYG